DDQWRFEPAGQITGTIDGGGGVNTLNFSAVTGSLWVNAYEGGNVINRVGVMHHITAFTGNGSGYLQAGNTANIWDLTNPGAMKISVVPALNTAAIASAKVTTVAATTTTTATATPATGAVASTPFAILSVTFTGFAGLYGGNANDTFKIGEYIGSRGSSMP